MAQSRVSPGLQTLLRLPACLRCQAISLLNRTAQNSSSTSKTIYRHTSKNASPKTTPPPRPGNVPPKAARTPPSPSQTRPPGTYQARNATEYAKQLLNGADSVLLYRAPTHRSLYFNAYVLGGTMILGAVNSAYFSRRNAPVPTDGKSNKVPWYTSALSITAAFMFAGVGTTFMLAPWRLLRTVSLLAPRMHKGRPGTPMLRFETKRPIPFVPFGSGAFEAPLSLVYSNKMVATSVADNNIKFTSIPFAHAQAFTESDKHQERLGILARLQSFNASLVDIWPAIRQDVGRMFLREGFLYVRVVGHDNWKLDLVGCQILENGVPLQTLMATDTHMPIGIAGWLSSIRSA